MYIIFHPMIAEEVSESKEAVKEAVKKDVSFNSNISDTDREFMSNCASVLADIPYTWRQYVDNVKGRCDILSMEYGEFIKAQTKEEKLHELEHLGSAVLHLYRMIAEQ